MMRQIYRSDRNKVLAGVLGGLGDYFTIDPTIFRIISVFLGLIHPSIMIVYIVCAIIIPRENKIYPDGAVIDNEELTEDKGNKKQHTIVLGLVLIGIGGYLLLKRFFFWIDDKVLLSVGIICLGVFIILKGRGNRDDKN